MAFVELYVEDFNCMIAVHLCGMFSCMRAVMTQMLERGRGVVANIASQIGAPDLGRCVANMGIIGLAKSLAHEVSA